MFVLLFLVVCLSVSQCTNVILSRNVSWPEARDLCPMVVPELTNNGQLKSDLPILNITTNRAWIGKYISQSKWIQFEGCFNTPDISNVQTFDISEYNDNRVWRCHNLCSGTHFGVTTTSCQCFQGSTRYDDIALVCGSNYRNESNGGFHGVNGCVCKYTKSKATFSESNQGNCLKMLFKKPGCKTKIAPCNSSNYVLCITGNESGSFRYFSPGSWFDNVRKCQFERCILSKRIEFGLTIQPILNRTYWLNTFRIQFYNDFSQLRRDLPKQCLALRISGNSGIGTEIRNCSDQLPVVCATQLNQQDEGVSPPIILIGIVVGSCVLVCTIMIVFSVIWCNKHTQRKVISDQQITDEGGDRHEYHEIEINTIESSPVGIYNILHKSRHIDTSGATSVYDHVQNSYYDEMSKRSKFGAEHDFTPREYDHVLNFRN